MAGAGPEIHMHRSPDALGEQIESAASLAGGDAGDGLQMSGAMLSTCPHFANDAFELKDIFGSPFEEQVGQVGAQQQFK